jgi:Resolvase, N terminal domain
MPNGSLESSSNGRRIIGQHGWPDCTSSRLQGRFGHLPKRTVTEDFEVCTDLRYDVTEPPRWLVKGWQAGSWCAKNASGADRSRLVLARLLCDITAGDTLVGVRLDRLARSVSHLLAVIEQLAAKGTYFRSLRDPIDTFTPQGMFSLQVLGVVAQLERALIADRTKAGLLAARQCGRVGGNPGLRAGDPAAIRRSRHGVHVARSCPGAAQHGVPVSSGYSVSDFQE